MTDSSVFLFHSTFPCSRKELYDWHARRGALERLIPPWENTSVVRRDGGLDPGGEVEMRMYAGPIPYSWIAHHVENSPGWMFRDLQHRGPFRSWSHSHIFSEDEKGAKLIDKIEYALPFHGYLPAKIKKLVETTLQRTFQHRRRVLAADLACHRRYAQRPMRILISGASGVLGRALTPFLTTGGHEVWSLVRREPRSNQREIRWDPEQGEIDGLPEVDAVIHFAGEYIGLGRWTDEKKKKVIDSRVRGTTLLAEAIAGMEKKPEVFLSSSAIGYYGDTGDKLIDESTPAGSDYISEVCRVWEDATEPARKAGIRTVSMRIGIALSPGGGALQRLLGASLFGIIRSFGSGRQFVSWISQEDTISAIYHTICSPQLHGPVNIVAPNPLSNNEFMQTLSLTCGKPLLFRVPAFFLKGIYGQMAQEILLSGCKASCQKLLDSGFTFRHETLSDALGDLLGKFPLEQRIEEGREG